MENLLNDITVKLEKFRKIVEKRDEFESSLETLDEMIQDSKEPLLVMVMGEFSTGKSTFINALVGEKVAAVNATPTTAVITKLCYGEDEKTIVHYKDGSKEENPDVDFVNLTAENQAAFQRHDEISFVERRIPMDMLKSMSIIDSPGLNSIKMGHTAATRDFMDKADTVLWMFDANKPVSQTEIAAMAKLNPRLEPIAIVNKMDTLNDDEDDESAFLDGIHQKLKDKVQKVIGISAKLAFIGKQNGNEKQLVASNLQEFYDTIDELVLPNVKEYKINTILDGMGGYICDIEEQINIGEKIAAGLQDEDYESYMEEKKWQTILRDGLDEVLAPMHKFAVSKNKNTTAQTFLAILYQYGFYVEKNEDLAEKMFEEAAVRNNMAAEFLLVGLYMRQYKLDKCIYWLRKLDEQDRAEAQCLLGLCYEKGLGVEENVERAVEYYKKSVEQEDGNGLYNLADCYMSGYGVPQDDKKVVELIEKAVKVGNEDAMIALANFYKNGELLQKDEKKAFALFEKAARKGVATGQLELALCYREGIGTEIDLTKEVYWLRRAALQDNSTAQYCLGMIYKLGRGVDENLAKSISWFKRAADNSDTDAMLELAKLEDDKSKSFDWINKAAGAGSAEAQVVVGNYYRDGDVVEEDLAKAYEWYKKAAEVGNTDGMCWLGIFYQNGIGISQDYTEALNWFRKATEAGDSDGMWLLGKMYRDGLGVQKNCEQAIELFSKASEAGNARGTHSLAKIYEFGEGVQKDLNEAVKLYKQAAEAGNEVSMCRLGILYQRGDGVNKDSSESLYWFKKAVEAGDTKALCWLGSKYRDGDGVEQDYGEAVNWYRKAVEAGEEDGYVLLAACLHYGAGVDKNNAEALELLNKVNDDDVTAQELKGYIYLSGGEGVEKNYEEAMRNLKSAIEKGADECGDIAYDLALVGKMYDDGLGMEEPNGVEAIKWYERAAEYGSSLAMNNLGYMYFNGDGVEQDYSKAVQWLEKAVAAGAEVDKDDIACARKYATVSDGKNDSNNICESNNSNGQASVTSDDSEGCGAGCVFIIVCIVIACILSAIFPPAGLIFIGILLYRHFNN